eukprot:s512_g20.t1
MAAVAAGRTEVLMASAQTDVSKLSGALAARLRASGSASVKAMGPNAVQSATRALLRCRYWLQQERADHETWLLVDRVHTENEKDALGELVIEARWAPTARSMLEEEEVLVSQKSNIGQVASFVANRLAEEPHVAPALKSVGPQAASQALRALAIARKYVAKEHPGEELLLCPREEKKSQEGGRGRRGDHYRQLVLVCHRQAVADAVDPDELAVGHDADLAEVDATTTAAVTTVAATTVAGTTAATTAAAKPLARSAKKGTTAVTTAVAKAVAPGGKATVPSTSKGGTAGGTTAATTKSPSTTKSAQKAPAPAPPSQGWISWIFSNWFYLAFFFGTVLPACMGLMAWLPMLSRAAGR